MVPVICLAAGLAKKATAAAMSAASAKRPSGISPRWKFALYFSFHHSTAARTEGKS
jgi:hypothetical protein